MYGKLSLQQAPPLSVPVRFFLTAPLFGILASLILLFTGKDLFVSRWTQGLLAATHCLTLGFFASVMIGAIQQLLPVLVGSTINRPVAVATLIHVQWVPGILLLVAAFFNFEMILIIPALILIAGALLCFISVILHSLYRGVSTNESAPGVKLAVFSLLITLVMGILLALGYTGLIPLWRPVLTNLHLSWGMIGWIALLIIVVAWQVVPMFQITRSYPVLLRKLIIPGAAVVLLMKSVLAFQVDNDIFSFLDHITDIFIATGLLGFALSTLHLQQVSRRKIRDSHRDFWRLAMINLLLTLCFWIAAEITGNALFDLLTGAVFLMGFAMSVVTGMLIKIVSFLIWLHLQAATEGIQTDGHRKYSVPKMKKIIHSGTSDVLLVMLLAAQISLIVSILHPEYLGIITAICWLVFFSLLLITLARPVIRYYEIIRELASESV